MTVGSEQRRIGLKVWGTATLLFLLASLVVWSIIPPALPKVVRLATGPRQGHYRIFGEALKRRLGEQGIELELVETRGSGENVRLLEQGEVDVAVVQSGVLSRDAEGLESICSVFFEPVLIVYRGALDEQDPDWTVSGKRIAMGHPGSGPHALLTRVLDKYGVGRGDGAGTALVEVGGPEAIAALRSDEVDVAFFVTSLDVEWVPGLFDDSLLKVRDLRFSEAVTRHFRFLKRLEIPAGLIDIRRGIPEKKLHLLATTASLVMRSETPSGIIQILIEACRSELSDGDLLAEPGEFPSPHGVDAPIHEDAARYFRHGPSYFYRVLPFRAAHLATRLMLLLLPLLTLLYPLLKSAGPLYRWVFLRRVFSWYRVLRSIEARIDGNSDPAVREELRAELARIGDEIRQTQVPNRFAADLFHLRQHHRLLLERLER